MFHTMRRHKQALSTSEIEEVLNRGTSGVLALAEEGGYPYAVPLSYVYDQGRIIFHCATEGHKLELIQKNPNCSFTVIDQDQVVAEEYTTYYRSAIVFGSVKVLEEHTEKRRALVLLAEKYSPGLGDRSGKEIDSSFDRVLILELKIHHSSGKEAKELSLQKSL